MASPSPLCTVANGAGAPVAQANGVNVTAGATITVALASSAGVNVWDLTCVGTDDQHTIATINASLVVNQATKVATFTAPAEACALRFQSRVNRGIDANLLPSAALTTTLGVYVLLSAGARLGALGETTEGSDVFGWTTKVNTALRTVASAGLNPRGTYSGAATYALNDFIVSSGVAYRAIGATTGNAPPNVTYWEAYSSSGGLPGVTVSGSAASGQVVTATSTSTAIWATATGIPQNAVTVYAAVNDGVTDNSTILTNASVSVTASGRLYLPPGGYAVALTPGSTPANTTTLACSVDFAPGAYLVIASGQTVIFNGTVHADDYQWLFRGAGTVVLNANAKVMTPWWGADSTGVINSDAYIQAAVDSASLTKRTTTFYGAIPYPPTVAGPSGLYKQAKPIVIAKQSLTYEGSGAGGTNHSNAGRLHPLFVVTPNIGGLPVTTSLATGAGAAFNCDYSGVVGPPAYGGNRQVNYHIPSCDSSTLASSFLSVQVPITVHFFFMMPVANTDARSLFAITGQRISSELGKVGLALALDSSSRVTVNFQPIGGSGFLVTNHPTVLVAGTTYYIEFTWNGTTANLFVGVKGASTGAPLTAPVSGSLNVDKYSMTSIGARQDFFPEAGAGLFAWGQIDSFEIKSTYDHSASFTTPTAKHTFGSNTLYGTNFELDGPNGELIVGYQQNASPNVYTVVRNGDKEIANAFNGLCTLKNFGSDGPLYCQLTTHMTCENIAIGGGNFGLWYNNNCYESKIANVNIGSTKLFGMAFTNGGVVSCQDSSATSSGFAFMANDSSVAITNFYAVSGYVGAIFRANGSDTSCAANLLVCTDEAQTTQDTSMMLDGAMSWSGQGCTFETVDVRHIGDLIGVSGASGLGKYTFTGCVLNAGVQCRTKFYIYAPTPRRDCIAIINPIQIYGTPGTPSWTNGHDECILPIGWARGVSSTLVTCNSLSGTATLIGGSGATVAVTFDVAEADVYYDAEVRVCKVVAGTPVAGSFTAYPAAQTVNGFTLTATADPGAGNTVKYLWTITRTRHGAAPTVTACSPSTMKATGGTALTVTGTGFGTDGGTKAYIGASLCTAIVVGSSTSLTCTSATAPNDASGTPAGQGLYLHVVNSDGQAAQFLITTVKAPSVIALTPATGTSAGGTSVAIAGTFFTATPTVSFGGTAATSVVWTNVNNLTCVAPAHAAGAASVTVTNPDGQVSNAQTYTYT